LITNSVLGEWVRPLLLRHVIYVDDLAARTLEGREGRRIDLLIASIVIANSQMGIDAAINVTTPFTPFEDDKWFVSFGEEVVRAGARRVRDKVAGTYRNRERTDSHTTPTGEDIGPLFLCVVEVKVRAGITRPNLPDLDAHLFEAPRIAERSDAPIEAVRSSRCRTIDRCDSLRGYN
jgi:hypothetical protein